MAPGAARRGAAGGGSDRSVAGASVRYFLRSARGPDGGPAQLGEPAGISKEEYKRGRHSITEVREVTVRDGRGRRWELDVHGFAHAAAPQPPPDFRDKRAVRQEYYPRLVEMVKRETGASRVIVLSHLLRTENPPNFTAAYAGFAHIDYGPQFEPKWRHVLRTRYGVPADEAQACGICALNVWHPIDRPAYKHPLCLLDYTSVRLAEDAVPYLYVGNPTYNQKTAMMPAGAAAPALGAVHSARHRWVFAPDMRPAEAVLFKQYDIREGVARCTFHTSFRDDFHEGWAECPGRRSFEARLLLTFPPARPAAPEGGAAAAPAARSARL